MSNGKKAVEWHWFIVGCVILIAALVAFFWAFSLPAITPSRRFLLLWMLPLASGFACGCFAGSIRASTKATLTVVATGGFAVWFLTTVFLSRIPTESAADPQQINLLNQLLASVDELKRRQSIPTNSPAEPTTTNLATVESAIQTLRNNAPDQTYTPTAAAPKWLLAALGELGQTEDPGPGSNPRIMDYFRATDFQATGDDMPWSAAFVNWCLASGGVRGTRSALNQSFLAFGSRLNEPREGCLVVLHRGENLYHAGFFLKDLGPTILVVSGNVSNAVRITAYPKDRVAQYRYPNAV